MNSSGAAIVPHRDAIADGESVCIANRDLILTKITIKCQRGSDAIRFAQDRLVALSADDDVSPLRVVRERSGRPVNVYRNVVGTSLLPASPFGFSSFHRKGDLVGAAGVAHEHFVAPASRLPCLGPRFRIDVQELAILMVILWAGGPQWLDFRTPFG